MFMRLWNFNPRSLTGATYILYQTGLLRSNFNPRSLTGATTTISPCGVILTFQSTLPHGSDSRIFTLYLFCSLISIHAPSRERRSSVRLRSLREAISIHAPSRERRLFSAFIAATELFQSTLPHGSDIINHLACSIQIISIHAPSRERLSEFRLRQDKILFQSSLPRGSDLRGKLEGAESKISILAPSRERLSTGEKILHLVPISILAPSRERPMGISAEQCSSVNFNPRSLAGATCSS